MRGFAAISLLVCFAGLPAMADITVTSYQTSAETNGYAPFSKAQYFDEQDRSNMSPATADASGDWTGTNSGGTNPTWHWIGSAHSSMTTQFTPSTLNVLGAAQFSLQLNTTSSFIEPSGVYSLGSVGSYECFFTLDTPANYKVMAQLQQDSVVHLGSFEGNLIFDRANTSSIPMPISLSGTIPPGHYDFRASAGLGISVLNGVNSVAENGSLGSLSFSVEAPEPSSFVAVIGSVLFISWRGPRRLRRCSM